MVIIEKTMKHIPWVITTLQTMTNTILRNQKMSIMHTLLKDNTNSKKSMKTLQKNMTQLVRNNTIGKNTLKILPLNFLRTLRRLHLEFKNQLSHLKKALFHKKSKMFFQSIFHHLEAKKDSLLIVKLVLKISSLVNP